MDIEEAIFCASLCKLCYTDIDSPEFQDKCVPLKFQKDVCNMIQRENANVIVINLDKLFICFRGSDDFEDIKDDIQILQKDLYLQGVPCGKIEQGFLEYFELVQEQVNSYIDSYISAGGKYICFTGHSAGATCTLSALETDLKYNKVSNVIDIDCYTFGSPRIGNDEFAKVFNSHVTNCWRAYIDNDIVPRLPMGFAYEHIGIPFCLNCVEPFSWLKVLFAILSFIFNLNAFKSVVVDNHSCIKYIEKLKLINLKK